MPETYIDREFPRATPLPGPDNPPYGVHGFFMRWATYWQVRQFGVRLCQRCFGATADDAERVRRHTQPCPGCRNWGYQVPAPGQHRPYIDRWQAPHEEWRWL